MIVTTSARRTSKRANPDPVVLIRSSAYSSLPAPGNRVGTGDASNMPTIQATTGNSAITCASGAHHYRLVGIQFKAPTTLLQSATVKIGGGESTLGAFPTDIVLDRCLVVGDATVGGRRGVELDGIRCAIIDSDVGGFWETGADSQAVWAYNTPGPLKIVNNRLEAASENIMFGGSDPQYANAVPSDIEIRRNYFYKPTAWIGASKNVKNLLEFKNAQRVLAEGNVFKNVWADGQNGFALLVTPRNQTGTASWCVTQDITLRLNKVLNVGSGINIGGTDDTYTSQDTTRITVQDNLFQIAAVTGGEVKRIHQMIGGPDEVQIINNTMIFKSGDSTGGAAGFMENNPKAINTVWRNNVIQTGASGNYGIIGTASGEGNATFTAWFTNPSGSYNMVIAPASSSNYSTWSNCQFPASTTAAKFTDYAGADYSLASDSPGHNAGSDGTDMGADFTALNAATLYSETGQWGSEPDTYDDRSYSNAELPREYVNTKYGAQSGNTWTATNTSASSVAGTGSGNRTDCSFSYALANCAVGDTIVLSAGSTYTGSWTLRNI